MELMVFLQRFNFLMQIIAIAEDIPFINLFEFEGELLDIDSEEEATVVPLNIYFSENMPSTLQKLSIINATDTGIALHSTDGRQFYGDKAIRLENAADFLYSNAGCYAADYFAPYNDYIFNEYCKSLYWGLNFLSEREGYNTIDLRFNGKQGYLLQNTEPANNMLNMYDKVYTYSEALAKLCGLNMMYSYKQGASYMNKFAADESLFFMDYDFYNNNYGNFNSCLEVLFRIAEKNSLYNYAAGDIINTAVHKNFEDNSAKMFMDLSNYGQNVEIYNTLCDNSDDDFTVTEQKNRVLTAVATNLSERKDRSVNINVDFKAYADIKNDRDIERFAEVFVKRLEDELSCCAEGIHF